jgi:hypothetical protein
MKKLIPSIFGLVSVCPFAAAIDLNGLATIAPLASYTSTRDTVTIACRDQSQVRFYILAPDLIRVRASFRAPLPERDHSWAIAKTAWDVPKWTCRRRAGRPADRDRRSGGGRAPVAPADRVPRCQDRIARSTPTRSP